MEQTHSINRRRKSPTVRASADELAHEIRQLPTIELTALRQKWAALFGFDPSPRLGRVLMVRAIAYRLQERALGGLKPSAQRILDRVSDGPQKKFLKRRASAGTVLIREWHGVKHRVTVLDHDVVYRGRRYKSLSEVARAITGTHWSGPVFFGLKQRAQEVARG
jgi:Protein of unknown function (DUF2924)